MKPLSRKMSNVSPFDFHVLSLPSGFHVHQHDYLQPGGIIRDMHYVFEMGISLSGSCRRFYDDKHVDLSPGQVWFCDMWQPHGFQVITPCSLIVITVSIDILYYFATETIPWSVWAWLFNAPFNHRPQTPPEKTKSMIKKFRLLYQNFHSLNIYNQHYAKLIFQEILLYYLSISNPQPVSPKNAHEINIVNSALKIVLDHPEFYTMSTVCRQLSVHPKTLSRYCIKYLNMSFTEFNLRHRLTCAAQKLQMTNLPVKHIAYEFGFTDTGHFCRTFSRYYHCTPTKYRQRSGF
jgi:AraC-like DNA-binding protein